MDSHIKFIRETQAKINQVSPSFCSAKWLMSTIHLLQGETHSCYHPWTHKIPLAEIQADPSALHNTNHKKQQRKKMLSGERPSECEYCWNVEDLDGDNISDRLQRSSETWAVGEIDRIRNLEWNENINPRHLEISFDSICNLKCAYCNPTVSSKWLEEVKQYGGYKTSTAFNDYLTPEKIRENLVALQAPNPYAKAFWAWWPNLYPDLKVFRITGGEPLLSKETFRVLDWINENSNPDLELVINSNLSVPPKLIDSMLEKARLATLSGNVKNFTVFGSIDTYGGQAEYIRTGLDYSYFMENVERILLEVPHSRIAFTVTFTLLAVPRFQKLLEKVIELRGKFNSAGKENRVFFDTPYLRFPPHLCIQSLPQEFHLNFLAFRDFMKANPDPTFGFKQLEWEKMERLALLVKQGLPKEETKSARKDFVIYVNEHDKRRKTNFLETFPELRDFYQLCLNS